MTAPRRTKALVATERALLRARERLAAGQADPWTVVEAEARHAAALNEALADGPAPLVDDGRDGVPRALRGWGGR